MKEALDIGYLLIPLMGGIGVAMIAGPLGAIMIWRRLAYFGDTLSHSGLLGITLALAFHFNVTLGVCAIALMAAFLLLKLQLRLNVASDTLLGLLSYTTLALGLLVLGFMQDIRVDVLGFLYGDILAMGWHDVVGIYVGGGVILISLAFLWQSILRVTIDVDLAKVEGLPVGHIQLAYTFLLAITIAVAIKMVGVLLITGLLLIPAAAARPLSNSPEKMACRASLIGLMAVVIGLMISHTWDLPTGPAIVVVSSGILLLTTLTTKYKPVI
ncbi:MAG: metal ABC transporter permease [Proteobacteria bacterium]|nr:metal ABC transporter permease [Pseudomonadota bacterium]